MRFQPRKHLSRLLAFTLMIGLSVLQACTGAPGASLGFPTKVALSTPIPPYVATDQSAAMAARATIQAAEAQAYNLSLTGTAVAVEVGLQSTLVSLQLTGSAATEQYFIRQTGAAGEATATAISLVATGDAGTQQAIATANAHSATATQAAADGFVRATVTQLAVNEMQRRDRSQQQSLFFRTWAGRIALVLLFTFGLVLIWRVTPWLFLKFFGVQSWQGKPILLLPDKKRGFQVVDIARSLGPGLTLDEDGKLITTGLAPDLNMQNAITARAQAAELLLAAGDEPGPVKQRVLRQASGLAAPASTPALPAEIVNTQFRVLPPDDPHVSEWLNDVEVHLLEDREG